MFEENKLSGKTWSTSSFAGLTALRNNCMEKQLEGPFCALQTKADAYAHFDVVL